MGDAVTANEFKGAVTGSGVMAVAGEDGGGDRRGGLDGVSLWIGVAYDPPAYGFLLNLDKIDRKSVV